MTSDTFSQKQANGQFPPLAQKLADIAAQMGAAPCVGNYVVGDAYSRIKASLMALADEVEAFEASAVVLPAAEAAKATEPLTLEALLEGGLFEEPIERVIAGMIHHGLDRCKIFGDGSATPKFALVMSTDPELNARLAQMLDLYEAEQEEQAEEVDA